MSAENIPTPAELAVRPQDYSTPVLEECVRRLNLEIEERSLVLVDDEALLRWWKRKTIAGTLTPYRAQRLRDYNRQVIDRHRALRRRIEAIIKDRKNAKP